MNSKSSFEKKIILAKVTLTFKNFLFNVKLFKKNNVPLGDVECFWPKNKQSYLICILEKLNQEDIGKDNFKQSIAYCKSNKLKMLVITMEYDNTLFEYVIDSNTSSTLPFKIIPFNRISQLNADFFKLNSVDPDISNFFKKEILKSA